jgi:phosphoadenosine phosphosulfate reductase
MSVADQIVAAGDTNALIAINHWLGGLEATERIAWAMDWLPGEHALSSSFGAQSAVSLHLATQVRKDVPVILVDTGYLFPETHRFVAELQARLALNLKVYRPRPEHGTLPASKASPVQASLQSPTTTACTRSRRCDARSRICR